MLFQKDQDGNEKPIYFYSAKLSAAEKNYSVTERECLSVIKAVKKFRPYIEGYKFTIITDHHSLKWLMTTKDLNGRLARWSLKLQPFTFDIEHRKGVLNIVPDSLSRQFCLDALYIEESDSSNCCPFILDFKDPSFESAEYLDLVSYVLENSAQLPDVTSSEGFVYKRMNHAVGNELLDTNIWKLWIPSALRTDLIKSAHDPPNRAHGGIAKTIHRLKERFYWPYMALDVRTYIKDCEKCQSSKAPNYTLKPPMEGCFIVDRPFQHLFLDFLGPYPRTRNGNTKMLIVVDQLTKFILLEPVKSSMHPLLVNYLQDRVFSIFGTPESILADNGPEFKSKKFEEFLEVRGVRCLSTAKYSPQGNSSERVNRSIVEAIRCYIKEHSTWDQNISDIASALRSAVHQTLQTTPYEALFGQTMLQNGKDYAILRKLEAMNQTGIEVVQKSDRLQIVQEYLKKRIVECHQRSANSYNTRTRSNSFKVDQEVWCRTFQQSSFSKCFISKFAPKFRKSRVLQVKGKNRYELGDLKGKSIGIYHAKDIKPM